MQVHWDESTNSIFASSNPHILNCFSYFLADIFKAHHDSFASGKKRVLMKNILNLNMLSFKPQKTKGCFQEKGAWHPTLWPNVWWIQSLLEWVCFSCIVVKCRYSTCQNVLLCKLIFNKLFHEHIYTFYLKGNIYWNIILYFACRLIVIMTNILMYLTVHFTSQIFFLNKKLSLLFPSQIWKWKISSWPFSF